MNTGKIFITLIIVAQFVQSQNSHLFRLSNYTSSSVAEDPYNPNWDWDNGDVSLDGIPHYWIYFQNRPNAIREYAAIVPWYQTGAWAGLMDRKKEDGWILLTRNFGTPTRRLLDEDNPYFVLFNTNRSVVRVFLLLENMTTTYNYSTMELKKFSNGGKETGALAHLAPVSYAMDKISNTYNNATSSVINTLAMKARWIYADFPLAFDKDLIPIENTEIPASLEFKVWGTEVKDLVLETKGFGGQGDKKFIDAFMKRNNFDAPGFSLNGSNMPRLDLAFDISDIDIRTTAPNWDAVKIFVENLRMDLNFGNLDALNPFKGLFDGFGNTLSDLSKAIPIKISGLNLDGLFKFFVGGGMKQNNVLQTAPTFFASHYSSTGTMTSKVPYAVLTIPLPASRLNYKSPMLGNAIGLVSNNPAGVLTLTKTPIVYKKIFYLTYPFGTPGAPVPQTITVPMIEFELADIPQIVMNSSLNLDLKSCEISLIAPMIFKPTSPKLSEITQNFGVYKVAEKATTGLDQRNLVELESPIGSNSGDFKSMPVQLQYSRGRSLKLPLLNTDSSQVKLKIKATLQRKDDPNAQPVVFIATYSVDRVLKTDLPTNQILPTLPPQNVLCNIRTEGAVISWDRNREKNIKYYAIERSINSGLYIQIGTTADTSFTDAQVKKAVKPYEASRQNVQVYYRVRALSEWTEEKQYPESGTVTLSQFSAYSNIANVLGSIRAWFDKRNASQIIPESNSLSQNFPNPFNPATTIYYSVKEEGTVTLKIYNSLGQEIAALLNERKDVGYHYAEWDASQYPSGVYYYRITNGAFTETKRMVLAK